MCLFFQKSIYLSLSSPRRTSPPTNSASPPPSETRVQGCAPRARNSRVRTPQSAPPAAKKNFGAALRRRARCGAARVDAGAKNTFQVVIFFPALWRRVRRQHYRTHYRSAASEPGPSKAGPRLVKMSVWILLSPRGDASTSSLDTDASRLQRLASPPAPRRRHLASPMSSSVTFFVHTQTTSDKIRTSHDAAPGTEVPDTWLAPRCRCSLRRLHRGAGAGRCTAGACTFGARCSSVQAPRT